MSESAVVSVRRERMTGKPELEIGRIGQVDETSYSHMWPKRIALRAVADIVGFTEITVPEARRLQNADRSR
jgi:hypothetical protein